MSDTIAALATPPGEAALAVIRVSGNSIREIIEGALNGSTPSPALSPRKVCLGNYKSLDGAVLDQLVWIYYEAPRSFTGDDMLELISHGSPFIVQRLLEDLVTRGCRLAEPGEFSRTAFLNGKMDLAQAEAIVDVIAARSEQALRIAQNQLDGALGKLVHGLVERLLRVTAHLEAYIDFPDEDLPAEDVTGPLSELADLQRDIDRLSATEKYRNRLQDGISIVLLGAPNAGKSSLLNQLVSDERAIVSEEAGTTRDYIEVRGILGGHLVRYIDTAGLRSTVSKIEAAGVAKSLHMAQKADLVLHVVDCQASELPMESEVAAVLSEKPSITVLNKSDLLNASSSASIAEGSIAVSALTGAGMESLIDTMANFLDADFRVPDDADVAVSARHAAALNTVKEHLGAAVGQLRDGISVELAATELHMAIDSMGLIVGRIDNEQMLDELFGSFCIGK